MPSITEHIKIPKKVATNDDLDFFYLRKKGIAYIEQLGGSLWTDFNSHDPGITMLEMLCYAITDLGMRINLPIEDLLSSKDDVNAIAGQFYKASEVFPTKAVTELDYRKLFIDIEGVKNCWLLKFEKTVYADCKDDKLSYDIEMLNAGHEDFIKPFVLNGLYNLLVDFDEFEDTLSDEEKEVKKEHIKAVIRSTYHENRNLCEDLIHINEIDTQAISVCANIEVGKEADEELVHAKVKLALNTYFSPSLRFYSIKEMLEKGYTPDQIFDGPLLENGFIDTQELKAAELRKEVRLSDIIKVIMEIEGVVMIKDISIGHCDTSRELENDWVICIDENKKPILCDKSAFSYYKGVLPLNLNKTQVAVYLEALEKEALVQQEIAKYDKELALPKGRYASPDAYTTIQNDFPDTYGIGQEGLTALATTQRKSQAKQLKGYLLFFDKILAGYFKHLSIVKELLSINGTATKTYVTQAIQDIKGFEELVTDYPVTDDDLLTEKLFRQLDNNIERRNKILDHLLARFAEKFGDYSFLMNILYGSEANEVILANKEAFLKDYKAISSERGCGFNYYNQAPGQLWDTDNISGFQKRVARLMGVKNYNRRHLTSPPYIEIYTQLNPANETIYKWRIRNGSGQVILSSITDYNTQRNAAEALNFAVSQVVQIQKETVIKAFQESVVSDTIIDTILIRVSDTGKYSFTIINQKISKTSTNYVVAKHRKFYNTTSQLKTVLIDIITFLKFEFTKEGMFLVEHILLRPDVTQEAIVPSDMFMPICTDNCESCNPVDPYSYRVSIVLPGYTFRFSNHDFRNFMEQVIKEELPSHILPRICWVGAKRGEVPDDENDLLCFENAYKDYLLAKTTLEQAQPTAALKALMAAMSKLNTIYPTGRLLDCDDESDNLEGRIILGQTNLGTL
jgi:hypothetical protein